MLYVAVDYHKNYPFVEAMDIGSRVINKGHLPN
jgi:hypothetical protein